MGIEGEEAKKIEDIRNAFESLLTGLRESIHEKMDEYAIRIVNGETADELQIPKTWRDEVGARVQRLLIERLKIMFPSSAKAKMIECVERIEGEDPAQVLEGLSDAWKTRINEIRTTLNELRNPK